MTTALIEQLKSGEEIASWKPHLSYTDVVLFLPCSTPVYCFSLALYTCVLDLISTFCPEDFPGHLLEPDPSDAAQRQLMHQREPPTMRDRMQTLGRRGGERK